MSENIRIVMMNGGLGNQLYQYAFVRCLEIITGEKCIIDDSWFWDKENMEHNGYELENVFGLKLNLLSQLFSEDVWREMIKKRKQGISIPQQLFDNELNLTMFAEASDYRFNGNVIRINPAKVSENELQIMAGTCGTFYYHGYWVNSMYISLIIKELRDELCFPGLDLLSEGNSYNLAYADAILKTNSVTIHIRRGDFVKIGRAVKPEVYKDAVEKMMKKIENATFFVFSDDSDWCRKNEIELGFDKIAQDRLIYVEGNCANAKNYIDMQLMSLGKNMIISNSSFGQWAFYLNQNTDVNLICV